VATYICPLSKHWLNINSRFNIIIPAGRILTSIHRIFKFLIKKIELSHHLITPSSFTIETLGTGENGFSFADDVRVWCGFHLLLQFSQGSDNNLLNIISRCKTTVKFLFFSERVILHSGVTCSKWYRRARLGQSGLSLKQASVTESKVKNGLLVFLRYF